jgi:hypothetical protein
MSELRKKARERAEAATLRALQSRGSIEGEAIPRHVRESLLKKELIAEVARLYFGPRAWAYRLTPAGEKAAGEAEAESDAREARIKVAKELGVTSKGQGQ